MGGAGLLLNHLAYLGVTLLLVQSLNLVWKTRLFSLGHQGFFALGAYTAAVTTRLALGSGAAWSLGSPGKRLEGLALLATCATAGALVAGVSGWSVGRLFARLRGDYFAVGSLIFAEMVRGVAANWEYVGGGLGFEVPYLVFTRDGNERLAYVGFYAMILISLNLVVFVCIRRLERSVYGLYISAVQDDPIAAELSGIDVGGLQQLVWVLGCGTAGAAGGIFLHFTSMIVPGDFSFVNALPVLLGVVLGTGGSRRCIMATVFIYTCYEVIKLRFFGLLGSQIGAVMADWKEALLGLILVLASTVPGIYRRVRLLAAKSEPVSGGLVAVECQEGHNLAPWR